MSAFDRGYEDGLDWDLDGFADWAAVEKQKSGWDEATINALGSDKFAAYCGISETEGEVWEGACADYNRGAHHGACDREMRRDAPPRSECA